MNDETKLTDHALGELTAKERAELEATLRSHEADGQTTEELRRLGEALRQSQRRGSTPPPSAELRQVIENRLDELEATEEHPLSLREGTGEGNGSVEPSRRMLHRRWLWLPLGWDGNWMRRSNSRLRLSLLRRIPRPVWEPSLPGMLLD